MRTLRTFLLLRRLGLRPAHVALLIRFWWLVLLLLIAAVLISIQFIK